VLDALPAAVYTTDADGSLTYYNRAPPPALAVMDIRLAGPRDGIAASMELRSQMRIRICICDRPPRQGYASTRKRRAASRLAD
jgi:hypothetical protein